MNIYLISEDGENFCVKAETMSEATDIAKQIYIEEVAIPLLPKGAIFNKSDEEKYYENEILLNCFLVGELKTKPVRK